MLKCRELRGSRRYAACTSWHIRKTLIKVLMAPLRNKVVWKRGIGCNRKSVASTASKALRVKGLSKERNPFIKTCQSSRLIRQPYYQTSWSVARDNRRHQQLLGWQCRHSHLQQLCTSASFRCLLTWLQTMQALSTSECLITRHRRLWT